MENSVMDLKESIRKINSSLEKQGSIAVQKKPSIGSRPALYGYRPQVVFDTVNNFLGPLGWKHDVDFSECTEKQAVVKVAVSIQNRTSVQFGEAQIVKNDKGSALKGAVTDGIQKALSLFGIGSKAYRGELKDVFDSKVSQIEISTGFESMIEVAKEQARIGIEEGRSWWRQNLAHIQVLSNEERKELVSILGGGK